MTAELVPSKNAVCPPAAASHTPVAIVAGGCQGPRCAGSHPRAVGLYHTLRQLLIGSRSAGLSWASPGTQALVLPRVVAEAFQESKSRSFEASSRPSLRNQQPRSLQILRLEPAHPQPRFQGGEIDPPTHMHTHPRGRTSKGCGHRNPLQTAPATG